MKSIISSIQVVCSFILIRKNIKSCPAPICLSLVHFECDPQQLQKLADCQKMCHVSNVSKMRKKLITDHSHRYTSLTLVFSWPLFKQPEVWTVTSARFHGSYKIFRLNFFDCICIGIYIKWFLKWLRKLHLISFGFLTKLKVIWRMIPAQ